METRDRPYSVLIVDDIPAVRESLGWLLNDQKDLYVAGAVGDGLEAIERVRELAPQVVILDIELPKLDGYAVTRYLKSLPHPPVVIFLSMHADPASRQRAKQAGGDGFCAKSDGWPALIEQLHAVLENEKGR